MKARIKPGYEDFYHRDTRGTGCVIVGDGDIVEIREDSEVLPGRKFVRRPGGTNDIVAVPVEFLDPLDD